MSPSKTRDQMTSSPTPLNPITPSPPPHYPLLPQVYFQETFRLICVSSGRSTYTTNGSTAQRTGRKNASERTGKKKPAQENASNAERSTPSHRHTPAAQTHAKKGGCGVGGRGHTLALTRSTRSPARTRLPTAVMS